MKKIILGLILSVGVSGFVMANTNEVKNNNLDKTKVIIKTETITKISENVFLLSCDNNYKLRVNNCDGTHTMYNLGTFEGSCNGAASGTVIMHLQTLEADCGQQ